MAVYSQTSGSYNAITFAAQQGVRTWIKMIQPTFSATPVLGRLQVLEDSAVRYSQYVNEPVVHPVQFGEGQGWALGVNTTIQVVLTSGSPSVDSDLAVEYYR